MIYKEVNFSKEYVFKSLSVSVNLSLEEEVTGVKYRFLDSRSMNKFQYNDQFPSKSF